MRSSIGLAVTVLAVLVMASCTTAHPAGAAPTPSSATFTTDAVSVPNGVAAAPLPAARAVTITLALAYPHSGLLDQFLVNVENPASPEYRQFLTSAEFEADFAPSASDAQQVATTLASAGGRDVTVAPDRLSVSASLTVGELDALFGVTMVGFPDPSGGIEYTAVGTPQLPSTLAGLVGGVDGLSDAPDLRLTDNLVAAPVLRVSSSPAVSQYAIDNATGSQWYVGSDFTNTFGIPDLFPGSASSITNATFPTNVAIATLLASGYNQSLGQNTPPWDPVVIRTYLNDTLAPGWVNASMNATLTGVPVTISGITPPAPGPFGSVNDSTLDEYENSLDLEMAGSLAPGAALYNFYFAGSLLSQAPSDADVAQYFDQDLGSALAYGYGNATLGVVTCSFGIQDLNDSLWDEELQKAAAMGVTVVAASGDQGNAPDHLTGRDDGQWPIWPATAAFNTSGALSVGGVSIGLAGGAAGWFNGSDLYITYDSNTTGLTELQTWWDTLGGQGAYAGSEGGISAVYNEPYWQYHSAAQPAIVNATELQGASSLGRAGPDIAFPANSTVAFVVADAEENVYFTVLEGTSIAAPAVAGLLADEIAVAHHSFGYIDPELYRIGSYYAANPGPSSAFLDVVTGGNYVFGAAPGWDPTTGWGVPLGVELYDADANPAIRDYVYTGPTPNLPPAAPSPPVPWTEIFLVFGVGVTVAVVLVILVARPGDRSRTVAPPPFGATMLPPPAPTSSLAGVPFAPGTGATFLCPYCGAPRPAEPVRCPKCGAL
jgi:kumamolisin